MEGSDEQFKRARSSQAEKVKTDREGSKEANQVEEEAVK